MITARPVLRVQKSQSSFAGSVRALKATRAVTVSRSAALNVRAEGFEGNSWYERLPPSPDSPLHLLCKPRARPCCFRIGTC
jgi:hypothetical protein